MVFTRHDANWGTKVAADVEPIVGDALRRRRGASSRGDSALKSDALVSVRGVGKVYEPSPVWMRFLLRSAINEPVVALDDLSFQVRAGEIVAVVGPNGAGKSTLFRVLTGLTTPTTGEVRVLGLDPMRKGNQVRRLIGFVPADDRSRYLRHAARENLIFHGKLQGLPSRELRARVAYCLELVGLTEAADRVGFALSAGMRARLQLARALLHEPKVLILDEPTGAIDPVASSRMLEIIENVTQERSLAVLISSHRLEEIESLHQSVMLLDRGRLVYRGDLDALRRRWERPCVRIRFNSVDAADAAWKRLGCADVDLVELASEELVVRTELPIGALFELLDGQLRDVASVQETKISLRKLLAEIADSRSSDLLNLDLPSPGPDDAT